MPASRTNRSRRRKESWRWSCTEKERWERVWNDSWPLNYRAEVWPTHRQPHAFWTFIKAEICLQPERREKVGAKESFFAERHSGKCRSWTRHSWGRRLKLAVICSKIQPKMALIITQFPLSPSASIQKRLKKEKKAKRKLQEALEFESKRRERVEDALKHSSSSSPSPEPLHAANNNTNNGTAGCSLVCLLPFCLTSFCFLQIFYCSLGFLKLLFVWLGFQSAVTVLFLLFQLGFFLLHFC